MHQVTLVRRKAWSHLNTRGTQLFSDGDMIKAQISSTADRYIFVFAYLFHRCCVNVRNAKELYLFAAKRLQRLYTQERKVRIIKSNPQLSYLHTLRDSVEFSLSK